MTNKGGANLAVEWRTVTRIATMTSPEVPELQPCFVYCRWNPVWPYIPNNQGCDDDKYVVGFGRGMFSKRPINKKTYTCFPTATTADFQEVIRV